MQHFGASAHLTKFHGHRSRHPLHQQADVLVVDHLAVDRAYVHLGGEALLLGVRVLLDGADHRRLRVKVEAEDGVFKGDLDLVL